MDRYSVMEFRCTNGDSCGGVKNERTGAAVYWGSGDTESKDWAVDKAPVLRIEWLKSRIDNLKQERSLQDAQLDALRKQEPVAYVTDSGRSAVMVAGADLDDDTPLYIYTQAPPAAAVPEFLLDGARLKLSFQEVGCPPQAGHPEEFVCHPIDQWKDQLQGQWGAIVDATNNKHMLVAAPAPEDVK